MLDRVDTVTRPGPRIRAFVKCTIVHGERDDFPYNIVNNPGARARLQATILTR